MTTVSLTRDSLVRCNSGKDLPSGVYFYKIDFQRGTKSPSGYLTIMR